MRILILFSLAIASCAHAAQEQEKPDYIPKEFTLQASPDFSDKAVLETFDFTDAKAWRLADAKGVPVLELHKRSKYKYKVRSPFNIGLIGNRKFGDFILEANLLQTGKEYGHRDMCLFFGFQDASHFYYVHIASVMDDHANQVFIVNDKPRTKISTKTNKGNDWGSNTWHHIRLERIKGVIKVFFDDMKTPIMEARDTTFGTGYLGFGSFDDTGMISNVKIWAPDSEKVERTGQLFRWKKD